MSDLLSFLDKTTDQTILIAPLNWGLGHAARCVPLIERLKGHNRVMIATDGIALDWLQNEYNGLSFFRLPSYGVRYDHQWMWMNMVRYGPRMLQAIRQEQKIADDLAHQKKVDLIISDHRLGFRSKLCRNVFLGHQLTFQHNNVILASCSTYIQSKYINRFDELWIPDESNKLLSGKLSEHDLNIPERHIGLLSRMSGSDDNKIYDFSVILSGPEPQRTRLEKKLTNLAGSYQNHQIALIRGSDLKSVSTDHRKHIHVYDLLNTSGLNAILNQSHVAVCRSGYSSIMDLHKLGLPAILVPTPGQSEQEYLARRMDKTDKFIMISQSELKAETFDSALKEILRTRK